MSLSSWTYDKKYCIQKPHSKDAKKNDGDGMWRIFLIPEMDLFEDFKFINSTPIRPHVKLPLKCQCLEPKKKNGHVFQVVTSFGPFSMTPWRSSMQGCPNDHMTRTSLLKPKSQYTSKKKQQKHLLSGALFLSNQWSQTQRLKNAHDRQYNIDKAIWYPYVHVMKKIASPNYWDD